MKKSDPRQVLWTNLSALMRHHWGEENLNRLAREGKFSPSTAVAIKCCDRSVGIDVVDKAARVFRLNAWRLLEPGLDPRTAALKSLSIAHDEDLSTWPFADLTQEHFGLLSSSDRARIEAYAQALVDARTKESER